jgi:hypothetical protein
MKNKEDQIYKENLNIEVIKQRIKDQDTKREEWKNELSE